MSVSTRAVARGASALRDRLESENVNLGNGERVASAVAGASLIAFGIAKRGLPGAALGLLGGALLVRGVTGHCDLSEKLGLSSAGPSPDIQLREAITINAPPDELYRYWRPLENLPRFMQHLVSVRRTGPLESHWVARTLVGKVLEWDARITAEEEGRFLAWETLPGSEVDHSGSVAFRPATGGRGTAVEVHMSYKTGAGTLGKPVAALFGKTAEHQIREDIRRLKQLMEVGEIPTTEGQTSARKDEPASRGTIARGLEPARETAPTEPWARELLEVVS